MQIQTRAGVIAGVLALGAFAAPAALAAGPTVSVRVEGASKTLLQTHAVTLSGKSVPGNAECGPTSVGAAIDQATKGDWDRGSFVTTLLGEKHDYSQNDFWAEWIDHGSGYKYGGGVCTDQLSKGDQVLMLVDQPPYGEGSLGEVPLNLKGGPTHTVRPGKTVTLRVMGTVLRSFDTGAGDVLPIRGATVSGHGKHAVTNARGRVHFTLTKPGTYHFRAAKPGDVASPLRTIRVKAAR